MLNTTHYRRLMLCVIVLMMGMAAGCSGNKSTIGKYNTTERYEILKQEVSSKSEFKNQIANENYKNLYTFLYALYKEEVEVAKLALKKLDLSAKIFGEPITTSLLMAASIPPEYVEEGSMGSFMHIKNSLYKLIGKRWKNWKGDKVIEVIIATGLKEEFVNKMRKEDEEMKCSSPIEEATFCISQASVESEIVHINFPPVVGHKFVKNCIKLDENILNSENSTKQVVKNFYAGCMHNLADNENEKDKTKLCKIIEECPINDWKEDDLNSLRDSFWSEYFRIESGKIKIKD